MKIFKSLDDQELVDALLAGKVGILPTDTLYGLVCRVANESAVKRLYALKSRENKPGTIIAASVEQLVELGIRRAYMKPVEHYWPNAISIIIPTGPILDYLHLGKGSLALRVVKNEKLAKLLQKTGPLLTSSANHSGEPNANNVQEAQAYFGDEVDFYVDGGDLSGRQASTIIRVIDDAVEVLREGSVKINEKGEIVA